jgi:hypothetical protein
MTTMTMTTRARVRDPKCSKPITQGEEEAPLAPRPEAQEEVLEEEEVLFSEAEEAMEAEGAQLLALSAPGPEGLEAGVIVTYFRVTGQVPEEEAQEVEVPEVEEAVEEVAALEAEGEVRKQEEAIEFLDNSK